ncbi:MAG TPA: hypothetical protein PK106_02950 [Bacteroidales bacterium]|nr:hypothetical protein [Bacteroidales bacterium]
MFLKLLILSIALILPAIIFLGIRILLKRNGSFPDTHVGHNREMRKRGITCAKSTNIGCTPAGNYNGCAACGVIHGGEED